MCAMNCRAVAGLVIIDSPSTAEEVGFERVTLGRANVKSDEMPSLTRAWKLLLLAFPVLTIYVVMYPS
jgi:hypothetical protein